MSLIGLLYGFWPVSAILANEVSNIGTTELGTLYFLFIVKILGFKNVLNQQKLNYYLLSNIFIFYLCISSDNFTHHLEIRGKKDF